MPVLHRKTWKKMSHPYTAFFDVSVPCKCDNLKAPRQARGSTRPCSSLRVFSGCPSTPSAVTTLLLEHFAVSFVCPSLNVHNTPAAHVRHWCFDRCTNSFIHSPTQPYPGSWGRLATITLQLLLCAMMLASTTFDHFPMTIIPK